MWLQRHTLRDTAFPTTLGKQFHVLPNVFKERLEKLPRAKDCVNESASSQSRKRASCASASFSSILGNFSTALKSCSESAEEPNVIASVVSLHGRMWGFNERKSELRCVVSRNACLLPATTYHSLPPIRTPDRLSRDRAYLPTYSTSRSTSKY